jgi:hypothetical protein
VQYFTTLCSTSQLLFWNFQRDDICITKILRRYYKWVKCHEGFVLSLESIHLINQKYKELKMENITNVKMGIGSSERPSLINKIKSKLSNLNKLTMSKKNNSSKDKNWIERNKAGLILAIALVSILITVKVAFNSLASSPVPKISKEDAINVITELYGSKWISEQGNNEFPAELRSQHYQKIEFSSQIMSDNLSIPIFFFQTNGDVSLGIEMGYISYSTDKKILLVTLPNSETLKFLYTTTESGDMENISLIGESNKRCYFTKEIN